MTKANSRGSRPLSAAGVLSVAFVSLVVGHLALPTIFPVVVINALGLILLGLMLSHVLLNRRDVFGFILIIFLASHFNYAPNQGGAFNLVAFVLLAAFLLRFGIHETEKSDVTITLLLGIFVVFNLLGWIFINPAPIGAITLGAMSLLGYILMFYVVSNLNITTSRLRNLLIIISVIVLYNFIVSLNHHYSVIKLATPLLALTKELFYATTNAFGIFGNSSVNGEYSMMTFAFLVPLMRASLLRRELGLRSGLLVVVAMVCLATIIISNTRGSSILAASFVLIYLFLFGIFYRRARGVLTNLTIILALCGLLLLFGSVLGLSNLERDFQTVGDLSTEAVISGKAVNRYGIWQAGWTRLMHESWLIGYGHGIPTSNSLAWGAKAGFAGFGAASIEEHHLHNLYLSLPMLYGWAGASAFLLIIFVTIGRLIRVVTTYDSRHYLVAVCLGFLIAWLGFLVEELKSGVMVQAPHYAMIVWIWLGLSNAAVKTLKTEKMRSRQEAYASNQAVKAVGAISSHAKPGPVARNL
jgi:hypothetical protein